VRCDSTENPQYLLCLRGVVPVALEQGHTAFLLVDPLTCRRDIVIGLFQRPALIGQAQASHFDVLELNAQRGDGRLDRFRRTTVGGNVERAVRVRVAATLRTIRLQMHPERALGIMGHCVLR